MGSCVSLSRAPPPAGPGRQQAAKVVDLDGSMSRFDGGATAREALLAIGGASSSPPSFLCSSDELGFDAPARALAEEELLQPGQLYFVLPASALLRPLSGQDMATLAVKAARALAVEAGLAAATAAGNKLRKTARVAPLAVAAMSSIKENGQSAEDAWKRKHHGYEHDSGRTVGKTRHHGVARGTRGRAGGVQRLSAIAEGSE